MNSHANALALLGIVHKASGNKIIMVIILIEAHMEKEEKISKMSIKVPLIGLYDS